MKFLTIICLKWMCRKWFELDLTGKQVSQVEALIIKVKKYGTDPTRKS